MQYFDTVLNDAINMCYGRVYKNEFDLIYPFTTENISGYIDKFNLINKSLLTVGSSSDQAINAIFNGCSDISVVDINPYTKFYYYLKVACLIELDLDEFLKFLRFKDYPKVFNDNKEVFNKEIYDKIKITLRLLDYESYLFWDELFNTFSSIDIRNLFSNDEYRTNVIKYCNKYLKNIESYEITRAKIKSIRPNFIEGNLFDIVINKKFDNIWLSNIGTYIKVDDLKKLIDKLVLLLNKNGLILISYLYDTTINSEYKPNFKEIYNLEKTLDILKEYGVKLSSFIGVQGIEFMEHRIKDSILVHKKN